MPPNRHLCMNRRGKPTGIPESGVPRSINGKPNKEYSRLYWRLSHPDARDRPGKPTGIRARTGIKSHLSNGEQNPEYYRLYRMLRYKEDRERARRWRAAHHRAAVVGPCEICHRHRKLGHDHNHETGKQRGLLCAGCNMKLGWLEEGAILRHVLEYLERYRGD